MTFKKGHKSGMTGRKHSEETLDKMRHNSNSGWIKKKERKNLKTEYKKENKPWNKGLKVGKLSKIHKEKISEGIIKFYDEKGRTNSLSKRLRSRSKWKVWRELVFLRDNFTCQNTDCEYCNNKIGVMIHPHHINPVALYPELAFHIDNGITYCAEYHLKSGLHDGIQIELKNRGEKCLRI